MWGFKAAAQVSEFSFTCVSVAPPLFLTEKSFQSRRHRKVATRQTLPNIQISLSGRRFSMMGGFLLLPSTSGGSGSYLDRLSWGVWDVGDSLDLNSLPAAGVHPSSHPRDLKGEDTLSLRQDRDRWCWVLGIVWVQRTSWSVSETPPPSLSMYPLTSDAAFRAREPLGVPARPRPHRGSVRIRT